MAKKKQSNPSPVQESETTEVVEVKKEEEVPVPTPPVPPAKPVVVRPVQLLSFDRWFAMQNRPMHHKAGMKAYANTKGKRPLEAWNAAFRNY